MMFLFLAAAAAAACPAEPHNPTGLGLAEKRWIAALEARDEAGLACRLAPDFADNDWRGAVRRRDEVLARLPQRPLSTLQLSELTTSVLGTTGVVRGLNTQVAPDGKMVARVRFTDVFVWRAGRWQAIAAQETVVAAPQP